MSFFEQFTGFFDETVFGYINAEILFLGMLCFMTLIFISFFIAHLFSKDIRAAKTLKQINGHLMFSRYDAYTENFILKKFKAAPYRFYENYLNKIDGMAFSNCVPYYSSSVNFGKKLTVCLYEIICVIALIAGIILLEERLILSLSGALIIPGIGVIFSVILSFLYDFIKNISHKRLEAKFAEFLKLLKPKLAKLQKNYSEHPNSKIVLKNFDDLMAKVKEIKLNGAKVETAKQLANDLAVAKNDCVNPRENDILTDALVDVLNIINDTAQEGNTA
ncbi:MAG: hypothetical protein FWG51_00910 [Firmicutes bacterium]|nr:hypothetical protein [Bacillota bacterium]